jgi:SAM-dependent methyltransferase
VRREVTTDLTVLHRLISPDGKDAVDIGCGGGALARELSARGTRMIGIEISDEQLAPALARDDGTGARYLIGTAQELPLADASVDLALFMRSLHHVPMADLTTALREARRVLRPGGAVYVVEPLTEGDYFALTTLIEDELDVREAVQATLAASRALGLDRVTTVDYDVEMRIAGVDAYRDRTVSVDPARAAVFDARRDEIAATFARLGQAGERPGERVFVQPMRADVLRSLDGVQPGADT